MKFLFNFLIFFTSFSIYSQIVSDSVEYTHIYISDTAKVLKIYKESKDYVNPFGPSAYFSIQIPLRTYFCLSLYDIIDSSKISFRKVIFKEYLDEGNYRIEDLNLRNEHSGIYLYKFDLFDSVYFRKVIFVK